VKYKILVISFFMLSAVKSFAGGTVGGWGLVAEELMNAVRDAAFGERRPVDVPEDLMRRMNMRLSTQKGEAPLTLDEKTSIQLKKVDGAVVDLQERIELQPKQAEAPTTDAQ
jgi:hypothetical protein